jgi:hypothetical protein
MAADRTRELSAVRFEDRIHATSDSQSDPGHRRSNEYSPDASVVGHLREGRRDRRARNGPRVGIVLGWGAGGVRGTFPVPIPAASGLVL